MILTMIGLLLIAAGVYCINKSERKRAAEQGPLLAKCFVSLDWFLCFPDVESEARLKSGLRAAGVDRLVLSPSPTGMNVSVQRRIVGVIGTRFETVCRFANEELSTFVHAVFQGVDSAHFGQPAYATSAVSFEGSAQAWVESAARVRQSRS